MAAKIIFQQSTGGSFDSLQSQGTTQGTVPNPGSGHPAKRIFNPDNTLQGSMDNSGKQTNWPSWLSSFEIGISGPQNTSATQPNCATFAGNTEATTSNCQIGSPPVQTQCGAPLGQFRVSEVDCSIPNSATAAGTGGPTDGIYLRAILNRNNMGSTENLLLVLEYAASSLNPAPANPMACWSNGNFLPENCSDFVWRAYIKHGTSEVVMPYLLLIPPTLGSVLSPGYASGTQVSAKQFLLPLAPDPNLNVIQISRTQSHFTNLPLLQSTCASSGMPGNTPLCAGVVFHSLTLYRI